MKPENPSKPSKIVGGVDERERTWIEQASARDETAFRRLIERYQDRVYRLALRIVRSEADAEEVAQDAFVRAWRALPEFRGESGFGTWLYRIVLRRAFDREKVLRTRRGRETLEEGPVEDLGSPSVSVEGGESARRLETLLARLPAVQRAAVTLYYYEDRSIEQISRALDLPTGTVKTHLRRARAALRSGWNRQEQTQP